MLQGSALGFTCDKLIHLNYNIDACDTCVYLRIRPPIYSACVKHHVGDGMYTGQTMSGLHLLTPVQCHIDTNARVLANC